MVLYDAFEITITMPFHLDLSGKNFCQEILRSKNFKPKLRHQLLEAVKTEAIQKLPLLHPWYNTLEMHQFAQHTAYQRWSPRRRFWARGRPRGHILKSLALASKLQVLKNCPVLDSRTALLFFEPLKSCWKTPEISPKICKDLFCFAFLEIA